MVSVEQHHHHQQKQEKVIDYSSTDMDMDIDIDIDIDIDSPPHQSSRRKRSYKEDANFYNDDGNTIISAGTLQHDDDDDDVDDSNNVGVNVIVDIVDVNDSYSSSSSSKTSSQPQQGRQLGDTSNIDSLFVVPAAQQQRTRVQEITAADDGTWQKKDRHHHQPKSNQEEKGVVVVGVKPFCHHRHGSRKAVEKLCLQTGELLGTFRSVTDAAKSVGVSVPAISYVLTGHAGRKSCKGAGWRYAADYSKSIETTTTATTTSSLLLPTTRPITASASAKKRLRLKNRKTIEKLGSETGKILGKFPSIATAAKSVEGDGCSTSATAIRNVLAGRQIIISKPNISAGGFGWRYADDSRTALLPSEPAAASSSDDADASVPAPTVIQESIFQIQTTTSNFLPASSSISAAALLAVPESESASASASTALVLECPPLLLDPPSAKKGRSESKTNHKSSEKENGTHAAYYGNGNGRKPVEKSCSKNSVEKCFCLETGDVLGHRHEHGHFGSLTEAAKSMRVSIPSITNAANGFRGAKSSISAGFGWGLLSNSPTSVSDPASTTKADISVPSSAQTERQKSVASCFLPSATVTTVAVPEPASTALTPPDIDPSAKKRRGCDVSKPDREANEKESDFNKRNNGHKSVEFTNFLKPDKLPGKFQSVTASKSVGVSKPTVTFALTGDNRDDSKIAESEPALTSDASVPSPPDNQKSIQTTPSFLTSSAVSMKGDGSCSHQDHQSYKENVTNPFSSSTNKLRQPVENICLETGKVLEVFPSAIDAAKSVGISQAAVSLALTHYQGKGTSAGFGWRYADSGMTEAASALADKFYSERLQNDEPGETCYEDHNDIIPIPSSSSNDEGGTMDIQSDIDIRTTDRSPKRIKVTANGEPLGDSFNLLSEVPQEDLSSTTEETVDKENEFQIRGDVNKQDHEHQHEDENDAGSNHDSPSSNQDESLESRSTPPNMGCMAGMKIEQVCLLTDKVMGRHATLKEASTVTGFSENSLPESVGSVAHGVLWHRVEESRKSSKRCRINNNENRAVEQLCLKTGEVLGYFGSAAEAAESMGALKAAIVHALSEDSDMKTCAGFGWRYLGSTTPPDALPINAVISVSAGAAKYRGPDTKKQGHQTSKENCTSLPCSNGRRPVEKICLKTGQIVGDFGSVKEAAASVGVSKSGTSKILNGYQGRTSGAGFGWRDINSRTLSKPTKQISTGSQPSTVSSKPPLNKQLPTKTQKQVRTPSKQPSPVVSPTPPRTSVEKAIEKFSVRTGKVLGRYASITQAALSVGVAPANIRAIVSSHETTKFYVGFGWRFAPSSKGVSALSVISAPAAPAATVVRFDPNYTPRQGDRFRVFFDTVKDLFGARKEAAGWYTGTATEVVPCYDRQCLVYLRFDDQADDVFEFPAPAIQRVLPSQSGKVSNKVFAVDGAGAVELAYECSPIRIEVGDVVGCKYPSPDKAEGQWHRGRVAIAHDNGACDVVFDAGDHDCNLEKSRLRLIERGREAKGWLVGLTIGPRENVASARISRIADDDLLVLTFPYGLEASRGYEQVAATLMKETLETVKARSSE